MGKFNFNFKDELGNERTLSSSVIGSMGSLEDFNSKEVCYKTSHSSYVFEKLENVRDGLFSHYQANNLDHKILTAQKQCSRSQAMDMVYGSMFKGNRSDQGFGR